MFRIQVPSYVQYIYHAFCWGVPLVIIIVLNVIHRFGVFSEPYCGIPDVPFENGFLFGPSAAIMFPAVILNVCVVIKITLVS